MMKAVALATAAAAADIMVVDFTGKDAATTHKWQAQNDPVMGGQSYSTVNVEGGLLNFTGSCKIVPSLKAPGFITARSENEGKWVDVSRCEGIKVNHKSASAYKGFRISFGTAHAPGGGFFARGYKANIVPSVGEFGDAVIPFSNFTDDWNDATGNPVHTCAENAKLCPTKSSLENFKTMSIWAEGVEGDIQLLVKSISGYNCHREQGCDSSTYCCPDVSKCLAPGVAPVPCPAGTCSDSSKTCCPLTKLCVDVQEDCKPICPAGSYCCPDALHCLTPTNAGVLCSADAPCKANETCCPLTHECVSVGAACDP